MAGCCDPHARHQVVFSYPPGNLVSKAVVATQNLLDLTGDAVALCSNYGTDTLEMR